MTNPTARPPAAEASLVRRLGLLGLAATGICSMMGGAINILPIALQRNVPGIGPHVLAAYALGAVPAVLAALAYAILGSAMPRAGGSYIYASRSLSPYLGFVASFSHWFGLSIGIGVVSYIAVPFLRDVAKPLGLTGLAAWLDAGPVRVGVALGFLWLFTGVNVLGVKAYERTLVPLMFLMFALGSVVIFAGFGHDPADFAAAVAAREGVEIVLPAAAPPLDLWKLLAASAILFSSFIGFDSIAQAGGEARDPGRNLPLAVGIAVVTVGTFYLLFTGAVYHTVPWTFMAERSANADLTAPGLLGYVLSPGWTVAIVGGAAIALVNDLPAMLLSVSRLMFAWAEDGIFPPVVARIHRRFHTPHVAIVLSALVATGGILGSHLAGDFFLGVDVLVTSMLVNFLLMCVSVLALPRRNPALAREIRFGRGRTLQRVVGAGGALVLAGYLGIHVVKDLSADVPAWYLHSTWIWIGVLSAASVVFAVEWRRLKRRGVDVDARFSVLPPQ
ncbi:MAG TPA: APC family permease [Thermoanaerobaculia bacterium]